MVHQHNPAETLTKTHINLTAKHFKNSENHTLNTKTFITWNKPGSENEQTVPR